MSTSQRHTAWAAALIIATILIASCGERASAPRVHTIPRTETGAKKQRPNALTFSDAVMSYVQNVEKADDAFSKSLIPILSSTRPPPMKDALASLDILIALQRAAKKKFQRLIQPTGARGRALVAQYRAYRQLVDRQLRAFPALLKILYDDSKRFSKRHQLIAAGAQALKNLRTQARTALYGTLCRYVKSHGIRAGDDRHAPCLKDGWIWLAKAQEILKAACACTVLRCARDLNSQLFDYSYRVNMAKLSPSLLTQISKVSHKAQNCISTILVRVKIKIIRP